MATAAPSFFAGEIPLGGELIRSGNKPAQLLAMLAVTHSASALSGSPAKVLHSACQPWGL